MSKSKINLIYLLGAGRSGTTAIATFLGGHPEITALGEMHQFFDHLRDDLPCSCGEKLVNCVYWSSIINHLPLDFTSKSAEIQQINDKLEYHSSVPNHLLQNTSKIALEKYNLIQQRLFEGIQENSSSTTYFLDSAKYLGRNLSLRKNIAFKIKTIYVVRDVRGVINSFSKNVQSSRLPLSTIFYYLMVNTAASISCFFIGNEEVLKLRYEDFMKSPEDTLSKIGLFLKLDMSPVSKAIQYNEEFSIGHLIGGNRLKKNKAIKLNTDESWKEKQTRLQQLVYYFLAFPIMILNKYRL